jgi:methionyl-tRNA formyltransferase
MGNLALSLPMKIVFAGTPEFASIIFEALLRTHHDIVAVMTQPDRPAGRGLKLQPSVVKQKAIENAIPVLQPPSLKLDGKYPEQALQAKNYLEQVDFDVMVVAAYGLILPKWLLDFVQNKNPLGCINVHASLLPRWRGAAPIHRAIWSGDEITGTCIMKMAEGLDTGPIIARQTMAIQSLDTTATLHDRLASQGGRILIQVLDQWAATKEVPLQVQPDQGVCYAEKIKKEEAKIDWETDASLIDRQIRALNPSPVAHTTLDGEPLKIWLSENISHRWSEENKYHPGQIVEVDDLGIYVAGKKGVLRLLEVQKPGGKRMSAGIFAKGAHLKPGKILK